MVRASGETIEPELPVVVTSKLMITRNPLPLANSLLPGLVADLTKVLKTSTVGEPTVLFEYNGLPGLLLSDGMVEDPFVGPFDGLAPPIGVQMETNYRVSIRFPQKEINT